VKHVILPVNEDLELPEGTVAPLAVIEHFINEASDHLTLNRCPCRCVPPHLTASDIDPAV